MKFLLAAADNPVSHVVPHPLHENPLFRVDVGEGTNPTLFIYDGVYEFFITNHLLMSFVAGVTVVLVFMYVASRVRTGGGQGLEAYRTKGRVAQLFETMCWFIRDEVARPNLGHLTDKYIFYIWTVFFFILFCNVLGLFPIGYFLQMVFSIGSENNEHLGWSHWGGTATSNLSLNVMLALCSFVAILFIGIRETGLKAFLSHFNPLGWDGPALLSFGMGIPLYFLEWLGLIIKCTVLAMRLFGTMMAGHLVIAVFVGFVFAAAQVSQALGYSVEIAVVVGGVLLTLLELFICCLQAFIFTFLTVLFISMVATHHGDHDEHHELSDEAQMDLDKLGDGSRMGSLAAT